MKKLILALSFVFILGMTSTAQTMCSDSVACTGTEFTFYFPTSNAPEATVSSIDIVVGGTTTSVTVSSRVDVGGVVTIVTNKNGLSCTDSATSKIYRNSGGSNKGSCSSTQSLPVEFISFNITRFGNSNMLIWSTASEFNNAYFLVQKQLKGTEGWMSDFAVEGYGTTNEIQNYSYLDYEEQSAYYRLRQVDYDGKVEYSNIVSMEMNNDPELLLTTVVTMVGQLLYMGGDLVDMSQFEGNGDVIVIKQYLKKDTVKRIENTNK